MASTTGESVDLSPLELDAWRGMLVAFARLVRELDAELNAAEGIGLTAYEVLLFLAEAPAGRLRMHELADAVLLSRSGLTRLVDDLERRGLVTRERCDTDGRGLEAVITQAGRRKHRQARVTHLRGVRTRFHDHLGERQLRALTDAWRALGAVG